MTETPSTPPAPQPRDPVAAFREDSANNQFRNARLEKLSALRAAGVEPYPYRFDRTWLAADIESQYADIAAGTETGLEVRICGRILAIRNSGMFIDLHDSSG